MNWKEERQESYSKQFWDSQSNRIKFFDEISVRYGLSGPDDWRKLSSSLIKRNGGSGVLKKYEGSILRALQDTFTNINWGVGNGTSLPQQRMKKVVETLGNKLS